MFETSCPDLFLDYFRVPYTVRPEGLAAPAPLCRIQVAAGRGPAGRTLWCLTTGAAQAAAGRPACYRLAEFSFFGHVVPGHLIRAVLPNRGDGWRPAQPITGPDGSPAAAIWRDDRGNVLLPFAPGEIMRNFWAERYQALGHSAASQAGRAAAGRAYYLVRPVLPRSLQLRLRRAYSRVQARSPFPHWPIEDSLHDLYRWLFAMLAELARTPVPLLAPWPAGRSWALVLTHDVETSIGYRDIGLLRDPERERGYRSSWNFVPLRYQVADDTLRALRREGCEVGVHGLRHDGRDLGSRRLLEERLPQIRAYAQSWGAVGFRSPATQRAWELMPSLGFDYDSSYPDTDPYEPQPGGCCSYLPYRNRGLVELPITMPQDHTLFSILQAPDGEVWLRKAQHLRQRGGMALLLTHPDYARDPRLAAAYRRLLDTFHGDGTAWHALPGEVATWWRERDVSVIVGDGAGWRIEGPAAARGRIMFAGHPYAG